MNEKHLERHESFFTPFEVADNFQIGQVNPMQFVTLGDKPFTLEQILYGADDIVMPTSYRQRQKIGRKLEMAKCITLPNGKRSKTDIA